MMAEEIFCIRKINQQFLKDYILTFLLMILRNLIESTYHGMYCNLPSNTATYLIG